MDNENINLDSDEFVNAPAALRDYAKNLKSQLHEAQKKIGAYETEKADMALSGVLTQAGFANPNRVKSAMLAEKIDPFDTNAVNGWIAANGNDFARVGSADIPVHDETPDYAAQAQAQHQMQNLQQMATPSGGRNPLAAAQGEVSPTMSAREVLEVLRKHGV